MRWKICKGISCNTAPDAYLSFSSTRDEMHYYNIAIALVTGLVELSIVNARVSHILSVGTATVLSDNDLAGLSTIYYTVDSPDTK